MTLSKNLIIIIIIILAFAYFFPAQFEETKDKLMDKIGSKDKTSSQPKSNVGQLTNTVDMATTVNNTVINQTDDTQNGSTDLPIEQVEICERLFSDYPDYYGTSKWGQDCSDADMSDEECLENPPTRYSGTINLDNKTGSPLINCCVLDGKCYWS